ncbi:MAG: trypsin-like peptidase domain-containing protein [Pirellulaceae bacterium]
MKRNRPDSNSATAFVAIALFCLTAWPATPAAAQLTSLSDLPTAEQRERMFAEVAEEVAALERQGNLLKKVVRLVTPTVVHIEAKKSASGGRSKIVDEAGSGVVIVKKDRFYILTNRHVIHEAPLHQIDIRTSDDRLLHPTTVWSDPGTDVAVMAVAENDLIAARMADSDRTEIGDFVLAVGSPFGLSHSVTYGIISAKGRRDLQLGTEDVRLQDFMQTDAAINPGNSGGPLLNLRGEVIGINTAIASSSGGSEGIGFTIPINLAMMVASQLIENGTVSRAFLGVLLDHKFDVEMATRLGLPRADGAYVKGITPGSPADSAEFREGDVILRFDGSRIEDDDHLINRVALTPVGKEVAVQVFRGGQVISLRVRVGDRSLFKEE